MSQPAISGITPVLIVDEIEPCAKFWEKQGFIRVAEVPHGASIGFVILSSGSMELMYQTMESVAAEDAAMAARLTVGRASLFVEVPDLDACVAAAEGATVVLNERTTFYGMREVGVLDPGGNVILFAQKVEQAPQATSSP